MKKDKNIHLIFKYKGLIAAIEYEAAAPTCMSYDYDPTPSGEQRLKKILEMIMKFKANL